MPGLVVRVMCGHQCAVNTLCSGDWGSHSSAFLVWSTQCAREEGPLGSRISKSGGAVWFCPGCAVVDQLYTLGRVLEDAWDFTQQVYIHVFCGLGEGVRPVCVGGSGIKGTEPPDTDCSVPVTPRSEFALSAVSRIHSVDDCTLPSSPLSILFLGFMDNISGGS